MNDLLPFCKDNEEKIKDLVNADQLVGINDICNKSDDNGLLIEIDCADAPEIVLNKLLSTNDNIIAECCVDEDTEWGINNNNLGDNHLGKIWMKIRSDFLNTKRPQAQEKISMKWKY